ncbi:MAG TPA: hypothetical protein DCQ37_06100 [Desulfobacteraceae bacterium]|jgi:hypothetical protein|nr:hypothetical protein [Desulfobacteraceae bacterium]
MARRTLSLAELWKQHETLYVYIFSIALTQLTKRNCLLNDEDKISEKLCPILNDVCFEESQKRKKNQQKDCEIRRPEWQGPIPPVTDNELKGGKANKRPDFMCKYYNTDASCSEDYEISLHIECKLLGNPTSKNWILNKEYVIDGIKRFDSKSHEYGKRAFSGLMIGYIISMKPEQIVNEVNDHQQKQFPDNPLLSFQFDNPPVFKENQQLNRKNVKPSSFQLIHLWVDLRT